MVSGEILTQMLDQKLVRCNGYGMICPFAKKGDPDLDSKQRSTCILPHCEPNKKKGVIVVKNHRASYRRKTAKRK